ncbi:MAG: hypothetical protein GF401_17825 [Chitinivibrionales bacterium]|nr:hypothetical protein [Chitinivibrionales bacterium]
MKKEAILSVLTNLCTLLSSVKQLMTQLGPVPDPDTIQQALIRRQEMLEDITRQIITLDHLDIKWRERITEDHELTSLGKRFKMLAETTAKIDKQIADGLKQRMAGVESELKQLTKSKSAAVSYAAHSMM